MDGLEGESQNRSSLTVVRRIEYDVGGLSIESVVLHVNWSL